MKMATPLVSICIPSYNYAEYLPELLESVLQQTYAQIEVIVVDDCSTDNSVEIIKEYAAKDPRIRLYVNAVNLGMVGNWNYCVELAQGEYVKLFCADDVMEPTCIERQVWMLEQYQGVTLVTCGRLIADQQLQKIRIAAYATKEKVFPGKEAINRCLFDGNYIGEPSATMFRKKDARRGFLPQYSHLIDLEMWFHLLERGDLAVIPEPLFTFRQHELQGTKNNVKSLAFLADEELLLAQSREKSYVRCTPLNMLRWRFKVAYNIWLFERLLDRAVVKEHIGRYLNFTLFMVARPLFLLAKKLVKIARY